MTSSMPRVGVVLGIDIGSTNTKVAALDETGAVVARASLPTPRDPQDRSIDASDLFNTIETMIIEACGDRYAVQAVAAAGVGEDGILVDQARMPLVPAMAWFDPRRAEIFASLEPNLPTAAGIGVATDPSRTLSGWAWAMRQAGSELASSWIALTDYAACRWSETVFMSDTLASRTAAWDVKQHEWVAERVIASLGSLKLLGPVLRAGDIVGPLISKRLTEAGLLSDDAVVVVGGHDHPIGGWGVDQMHPGAILDSMGTAEVVVAQSRKPWTIGGGRVDVSPGIRSIGTTLLCVAELSRNIYWASGDEAVGSALRRIIAGSLAPDDNISGDYFLPGGQGGIAPRFRTDAPANPVSRASSVAGALSRLGATAVRAVVDEMPPNAPIYVTGGWARAQGWLNIKRALSPTEIQVIAEPEVTAVGAALLAGNAIGWKLPAQTALGGPAQRVQEAKSDRRVKRLYMGTGT